MKHEYSEAEVYEISAYRQRLGHNPVNGVSAPEEPPQPDAGQSVAAVEGGVIEREAEAPSGQDPNNNTKAPEGADVRHPDRLFNYTTQLAFHEHELSQADKRGFPPGQTAYHAGKVAVLEALTNNVVYLKDYRGR